MTVNMYELTNDIQMPPARQRGAYPFNKMAVGDSFLAPKDKTNSVASICSRLGKKTGKSFVWRTVDGFIRVWRVK